MIFKLVWAIAGHRVRLADILIEALGFSTCGQCPWSLVDHLSSLGTNKTLVNKTLASK
ncbi:hypothetical protein P692DRAFT_20184370 [Suillus brevipes Sb2]|nr:hypothetical protein P692DRAFT_20184370 [Suillus brevipes Sb2]